MTMMHLMNCSHQGEGWCLACVRELYERHSKAMDALVEIEADLCPESGMFPEGYGALTGRFRDRARKAINADRGRNDVP